MRAKRLIREGRWTPPPHAPEWRKGGTRTTRTEQNHEPEPDISICAFVTRSSTIKFEQNRLHVQRHTGARHDPETCRAVHNCFSSCLFYDDKLVYVPTYLVTSSWSGIAKLHQAAFNMSNSRVATIPARSLILVASSTRPVSQYLQSGKMMRDIRLDARLKASPNYA